MAVVAEGPAAEQGVVAEQAPANTRTVHGEWLEVESLDLEGHGVAHNAQGKVVFVEGALPGETVQVQITRHKASWEKARMTELRAPSSQRVHPRCAYFGVCGGCKLQHLHAAAQIATKQRALEDALAHVGKVKPEQVLRPIEGPAWGYRYRARLSVRYVAKKNTVLVGFHERQSSFVADMKTCEILPPHVSRLLVPLRRLIEAMPSRDRLPQIEVAVGDAGEQTVTTLVLRHLDPLRDEDKAHLRQFELTHQVQWWLQPKGPDTAHRLDEGGAGLHLSYKLPEFGVEMPFKPTDFTQVNPYINRVLVQRALQLLDVQGHEHVIDWFCGLGNFTLPLATRAQQVLGIEGSESLVQRARDNAEHNGLGYKTRFEARNLFEVSAEDLRQIQTQELGCHADKWLIDPPREGAFELIKALVDLSEHFTSLTPGAEPDPRPQRIVYVSCNPATLARDAGLLVHQAGYRCVAAGAVNMFAHTAHVESIAVFERSNTHAATAHRPLEV
jgi:23S rRNA (uracil1939-C5)-methyltransferase